MRIVNITSKASLSVRLNLCEVALGSVNVEYKPNSFRALIKRIRHPYCTCSVFPNGKLILNGTTRESETRRAYRKIARWIQNLGYDVHPIKHEVVNIVLADDIQQSINLIKITDSLGASYEPETRPYFVKHYEYFTLLIYHTGKITITKVSNLEHINLYFPIREKIKSL